MINENKKYRIQNYNISVFAFSVMGDGKVENQDSFKIYFDNRQLIIAVADGLGSAVYSKEGSNKIVDVSVEVLSQMNDSKTIANDILKKWSEGIAGNLNQYDTTLKFIKITDTDILYGGIGDGWIAFLTDTGLISLTADNEFSNQTDSILSFDMDKKFSLLKLPLSAVHSGLVSTDGFSEDMDKDNADKMLEGIGNELCVNEDAFVCEMQQMLSCWPVKTNKDDKTVVFLNITKENC